MSSSSITTSIPTGPIPEWCLVAQSGHRSRLFTCPRPYRDGGSSAKSTDFTSICCDGVIVDTSFDLYSSSNLTTGLLPYSIPNSNSTIPVDLSNLICCPISGVQSEALNPTPASSARTTCAPGTPAIPLASLAATNASDASVYPVTYASITPSADPSATVTNDLWGWATPTYGASGSPVCFWANTASGVSVAEVTVPVSYVASATTSGAVTGTGSSATASPSSAAAALRVAWGRGGLVGVLGLGLLLSAGWF
ncbi:uncharacterized protein GGS22DRAFT_117262 [Annulohypoxylon maeteangense]|uniref:uncharacterized protein n=1 Tax=Annulohypoxylon maeteangense TaxID=1927788 RepID=UPI0020078DFA|nr:uncharacterized protein GGS22DRAFT_117262 [Annulohypoxylon maeteangense]KAI0886760.1 hypothetical protein GGS22DRAFT_117262 [Annulohypoxylon maeteangense]